MFLHEFCKKILRTAVLQNACARLSICSFVLLVTHLCKSICTNKDDKLHARHTVSYTRNSFLTEAVVLRKFAKFTEKQLCSSLLGPQLGSFLDKVANPWPYILIIKEPLVQMFPVNFRNFEENIIFIEHMRLAASTIMRSVSSKLVLQWLTKCLGLTLVFSIVQEFFSSTDKTFILAGELGTHILRSSDSFLIFPNFLRS